MFDSHASPTNPEVRRERSDANVRAIVAFGIGLAGLAILVHLLLAWMFGSMDREEERNDPGLPKVAQKRLRIPGELDELPKPILQKDDRYDLRALRKEEDSKLQAEGKYKAGRIPIAVAMKRLEDPAIAAANGLRFRPPSKSAQKPESEGKK
jgi:hypothetical protein